MCQPARRMPLAVPLALVMAGAALALATDLPKLRCPIDATTDQCSEHYRNLFIVDGNKYIFLPHVVNKSIGVDCHFGFLYDDNSNAAHMSRWLPQFTPALHVQRVDVTGCLPTHYATMLAALNVKLTSPLNFDLYMIKDSDELDHTHFADLPPLRHLGLWYSPVSRSLPASLNNITMLTLTGSGLQDDILEALPRTLTELQLRDVNIRSVPAAVMDLPELRSLHVWTTTKVDRGNASRLQQLYVDSADAALMSDWAPPALEEVTLWTWQAVKPNPVPACDNLVKLKLFRPRVSELPAGWVGRCPRLEVLHIKYAGYLSELPARLLENATQLTSFGLQHTSISSLPAQLFADTPHLTHLDLSNNQFKELPSALLTLPLWSLDLGYNKLNTGVVAEVVSAFTELRNLSLAWNPEVGDLCAVNSSNITEHKLKSSLASLSKLERLELQGTNISVICSDWREDMVNLTYLDLSDTKLGNVTYENLRYKRSVPAVVKLSGTVYFSADDYNTAAAAAAVSPPTREVTVMLSSHHCYDCSVFWLRNALKNELLPLDDVVIGDGHFYSMMSKSRLRTIGIEGLLCDRKICASVPSGCDCGTASGRRLRVVCVGTALDLDAHFKVLELRNNSISYETETTDPALECSCRVTPALMALDTAVLLDYPTRPLIGYDALRNEDPQDTCSRLKLY